MPLLERGKRMVAVGLLALFGLTPAFADQPASSRRTPLVAAVAGCRDSVVNLRGRKPATEPLVPAGTEESRHVNGMGTGVVIDSRGYVLTNYHVVQDVENIQVTTSDNQQCWATLIAHDPVTDLALIKISLRQPLPEIRLGRSSDLMLAETVAAVGNAYGYEHTVTTGIISHLDRTVQVNDHQIYEHLIQTDAPINPGNSGGPLLNLDGEMIGVNVAVRVGAQGIAFAIPVDRAIDVAGRLIDQHTRLAVVHGLDVETRYESTGSVAVVRHVAAGSPGATAGFLAGDVIAASAQTEIRRAADFYRTLLERKPGEAVALRVRRTGQTALTDVRLDLASPRTGASIAVATGDGLSWQTIGLRLTTASDVMMAGRHPDYPRGLQVLEVRPNSPAAAEGIRPGDILVAMHGWKTETVENLDYILNQDEIRNREEFRFYILRDREPFFGQMRVAER
jgi:serine protease Do